MQSSHSQNSDLRKIAIAMDSKLRLPGGFKIGWDGVLGFIPGIGDAVTNLISFYILVRAAGLGVPPSVLLRMGLNILIDNLFDMIPIVGNIFDFIWKSNIKNIDLIERYLAQPSQTKTSSRIVVGFTLFFILLMTLASIALVVWIASLVWSWISQSGANFQ